jgi:hypothetical protein
MKDSAFFPPGDAYHAPPLERMLRSLLLPPLARAPKADWIVASLVGLGLVAILLPTASALLGDPDMLWHIRTGQDLLATGRFPTVDSYSWTMSGQHWIAKEWLSQALYALVFDMVGWTGAALLALFSASAAYAIVFAEVERRAGAAFAFAAVLAVPLAGNFHLLARPHVLAWPVAAAFAAQALDAAERGRAPPWLAAILVTLWANLHGSFLLAFVLLPFFAWESLARADGGRQQLALRWLCFFLVCGLAALVHPYGWRVFAAAWDVLALGPAMSLIVEWRPQDFSGLGHFEFILLIGFGAALLTGLRLPAPRAALLLALLHSALAHVRQETLALMIVAMLVAAPVAALCDATRFPREKRRQAAVAACVLLSILGGFALCRGPLALPPQIAPHAALAAARADGVEGQVLNEDQFAGFLISERVPTYVDGRAELFGMMHYEVSMALAGRKPDILAALLADRRIGWTILPSATPANGTLAASPDWLLVYHDQIATVYARR